MLCYLLTLCVVNSGINCKTILVCVLNNNMSITKLVHAAPVPTKPPSKPYGKIVLTLKNCLLPEEKLLPTPSQVDGLDFDIEIDQRILGCELIQTAGILLKLPQVAMATGSVLFQRFYYSKSFVRHSMETTAMGCVCLASKIEEAPRRIRDVINVFHHVRQIKGQKTIAPMVLDHSYISLKSQVIKAERRVLKELGFCVHVKHPHKIIVMYLQVLGYEKNVILMQLAWNYMNDALRTDLFVRYQPETVACACIYLTSRKLGVCLPKSPPWYKIFKVSEKDLQDVCHRILRLYRRPKPNAEELEKKVDDLRRHYQDARSKARNNSNLSGANTPASSPTPAANHSDAKSPEKREKRPTSPRRNNMNSNTESEKRKSRTKSPSRTPLNSKHSKKNNKRVRQRSVSRSRSRSHDNERKQKKGMNHHKRRSHSSRSPSLTPQHNRHSRKAIRDRIRYRSRSRSPKRRSTSYDRYDSKYDKSNRSKRLPRVREGLRIKDGRR